MSTFSSKFAGETVCIVFATCLKLALLVAFVISLCWHNVPVSEVSLLMDTLRVASQLSEHNTWFNPRALEMVKNFTI